MRGPNFAEDQSPSTTSSTSATSSPSPTSTSPKKFGASGLSSAFAAAAAIAEPKPTVALSSSSPPSAPVKSQKPRGPPSYYACCVLTFDIDDTLWGSREILEAAAEDCLDYFRVHCPSVANVISPPRDTTASTGVLKDEPSPESSTTPEKLSIASRMRRIAKTYPHRYLGQSTGQILRMSELRKMALQEACEDGGIVDPKQKERLVNESFERWRLRRHHIDEVVTDDVLKFLAALRNNIRTIYTRRTSLPLQVLMGGITNGNCRLQDVPVVKDLFDFCINAEDVEALKPDDLVFQAAELEVENRMDSVMKHPALWVHIGDDIVADMLPAKRKGWKTVWVSHCRQHKLETFDAGDLPAGGRKSEGNSSRDLIRAQQKAAAWGSLPVASQKLIDCHVATLEEAMVPLLQWIVKLAQSHENNKMPTF